MMAVLAVTLSLWILGPRLGISAGTAAMMGLSALMLTGEKAAGPPRGLAKAFSRMDLTSTIPSAGVVTWDQCLQNSGAWDTLMWFAMCEY